MRICPERDARTVRLVILIPFEAEEFRRLVAAGGIKSMTVSPGFFLNKSKVRTMMRDRFAEELDALHARSLDRHLREITGAQGSEIEIAGRRFINFSSNDYLGLANDPRLREAATAAIAEFGFGAGASRLI